MPSVVLRVWAHMQEVPQVPMQNPLAEYSDPTKHCLEPFLDAISLDESTSSQGPS
jgi:hypothetical protein